MAEGVLSAVQAGVINLTATVLTTATPDLPPAVPPGAQEQVVLNQKRRNKTKKVRTRATEASEGVLVPCPAETNYSQAAASDICGD